MLRTPSILHLTGLKKRTPTNPPLSPIFHYFLQSQLLGKSPLEVFLAVMEIATWLLVLLFSIFSIPCFLLLVVLTELATRLATILLRPQSRERYTWPSRYALLGYRIPNIDHVSSLEPPSSPERRCNKIAVARYNKCESEEEVECVFCLCKVEEGEEVRKLRCRHVFHRTCLDGWLLGPRATCPLCRDMLLPCEAAKPCSFEPQEEEEEEALVRDELW